MKIVDLAGRIFGELYVIERLSTTRGGSVLWRCRCSCGNLCEVSTRHLNRKNNTVRSCGCKQIKRGKEHAQWNGYEDISGNWWVSHVKHSSNCSKRKTLVCSITIQEAWELFIKQDKKCYFTKEPLVIHTKCSINTASLDRIDNTKGYTIDNVRWVHKHINMMRRVYDDAVFIGWCKKVADNFK